MDSGPPPYFGGLWAPSVFWWTLGPLCILVDFEPPLYFGGLLAPSVFWWTLGPPPYFGGLWAPSVVAYSTDWRWEQTGNEASSSSVCCE